MAVLEMDKVLTLVPKVLAISFRRVWFSYDEGADLLDVNFKKPSRADDSELTDDDVIIRYEGEEVVGMTVLNASKRLK